MNTQPPKYALRFLRWFCREDYLEEIEGDLFELFEGLVEEGSRWARLYVTWHVLLHLRPDFIRAFDTNIFITPGMLKHNLLISYRGFLRNKSSFLINLAGLSTGLACVILIYLWVSDEYRVDAFHKDTVHQVLLNIEFPQNIQTWEWSPLPLARDLLEDYPEVEYAVSTNDFFHWGQKEGIASLGDTYYQVEGRFVGESFFDVFSYKLLQGDRNQVLQNKSSVVISEDLALKLFGSTDVLGKDLEWAHKAFQGFYQVSGVFENISPRATDRFDILFHLDELIEHTNDNLDRYGASYVKTYVVLNPETDTDIFNTKIHDFVKRKDERLENLTIVAQKYADKYLYGQYENGKPIEGRIIYVRLFSWIAIFLLLIACVNFMNLSTAQASLKMKEIGVKKTFGASREALMTQFVFESVLITIFSTIVALGLVALLLPYFNEIAGKQLALDLEAQHFFAIGGIVLFTGVLSGSYPAFYLSGFRPLSVLKGKLEHSASELWIRKGLVVFQFVLSIVFMIGFWVIHEQIQYTQDKNLGYSRDNVISFQWKGELYDEWSGLGEEGNSNSDFYAFMAGLREIPGVLHASNMYRNMLDLKEMAKQSGVTWTGDESERNVLFESPVVSYDFIETMGMEMIEGRSFSLEHKDDYSKIILNEACVKLMGLDSPVGTSIGLNGQSQVIGVVKNFHYGSLHNSLEPLIFRCNQHGGTILAKIQAGTEQETLAKIKAHHKAFLPKYSFDYTFMDDDYLALYESETRVASLSTYFAGIAIIISCLGLLGLAAFSAARRTKEIGIRKVLGSSVPAIVGTLSKDFTRTLLLSIVLALPLAYFFVGRLLSGFSERIALHWAIFVGAACITLTLAWLTVGIQMYRAASVNPIESLRSE